MTQQGVIGSVQYFQSECLKDILSLHCQQETFDLDPTYSKGNFYVDGIPRPKICMDIDPQQPFVIKADVRCLPLVDASVYSTIFDPPFLATTGPSLSKVDDSNVITKRFGVYPSETELHQMYSEALEEIYRVTKPGGYCVFKCQDKVSSGKQYFSHCFIHNKAVACGWYPKDLFILTTNKRIVAPWQRNQQHARKYHSYLWVLQKIDKAIAYV